MCEYSADARLVTDASLFGIGSVVKTFLSALIGMPFEGGHVDIDGRPGDYVAGRNCGDEGGTRSKHPTPPLSDIGASGDGQIICCLS